MPGAGGDIQAELGLGISQFLDAVNRVEQRLQQTRAKGNELAKGLTSGMAASAAAVGGAAGAITSVLTQAVTKAMAGLKEAFNIGPRLVEMADLLGTTAGQARVLEAAFERAGMAGDEAVGMVNKLQKHIVDAAAGGDRSIFTALGLDPEQLAQMDPTEAFQVVGRAIAGIDNATVRAAASMEVFGKSGGKLLGIFGPGGHMDKARDILGGQVKMLDENAANFKRATAALSGAWKSIQGFFVGAASGFVSKLMPAFDTVSFAKKFDLSAIGKKIGEMIGTAIDYIRAAWEALDWQSAAELFGNAFLLGLKEAVNFFWAAMWGGVRAFGQSMVETMKTAVEIFSLITTLDFWKGVGDALMAVFHSVISFLALSISKILHEVAKIPGFGRLEAGAQIEKEVSQDEAEKAAGLFIDAGKNLDGPLDAITTRFQDAAHDIWDAFKQGVADTDPLFDTDKEKAAIDAITAKIQKAYEDIAAANKKASESAEPGANRGLNFAPAAQRPGVFAQAVNFLMGRSINELQLEEAKSQTAQLIGMNKSLGNIEAKLAPEKKVKVEVVPTFS